MFTKDNIKKSIENLDSIRNKDTKQNTNPSNDRNS